MKFKAGDIIQYDEMVRKLYIVKGELGYCSSYGDFVPLKNSDLKWKKVQDEI